MLQPIYKYIPWIISAWIIVMLASLKFGWLDPFFWAAQNAKVQGIDYFALPKSYLNLLEGRSAFNTWAGKSYGPYATWYIGHPAFSVFIMSWFSFLSPWNSYAAFVVFSLMVMLYCGYLFSKHAIKIEQKSIYYMLLLVSFPVYWMLYVGNMHAPLVLATTLLLLAVYEITYAKNMIEEKAAGIKLLAGLLISFFSKPIVILLMPALLVVKETRKNAFIALILYIIVSLVFILVPMLNPEGVGLNRLLNVVFDFNYIKETMNIYKNKFVLTEYMKDNGIHWMNLIAQSEHRLNHIEVFSLPVFIDTLLDKQLSSSFYKIPLYTSLLFSLALAFIQERKTRLNVLLLIVMGVSLSFFLSYNTVWEYQFATVLPVIAMLYLLKEKQLFSKELIKIMLATGVFFYLPSFYFLIDKSTIDSSSLSLIRVSRVLPALILFMLIFYKTAQLIFTSVYSKVLNQKSQAD
ncbi:MAG: hypothetical protein H0V01_01875 [Bacteroidetes bacterium]|nr:hypothetical protein [Bacteroidota bacterium]HET6243291.1 hypothetical protein [Bacteroidia bacterium]